jgi:hypothetical protein
MTESSKPEIEMRPVVVDGDIQLYDIYVEGRWIGSRRTIGQCRQAVAALNRRRQHTQGTNAPEHEARHD